jgi:para-nitrobenzyl esterase
VTGFGRREFLVMAAALTASGPAGAQAAAPARGRVVRVREGVLAGSEAGGIVSFRGVPYAAPPVGPLRFKPPAPAIPWQGIRAATRFGPAPIQINQSGVPALDYLGAPRAEDCLQLNIWAPARAGPHPVLVWIHGGANEAGAASQPLYNGANFARAGLVCVTVGFRLGMFGFLELGELLGPSYRGSANNGLRDIVAALRWVRDNIRAFGGDPRRVTLVGESAGAKNVCSLIASPWARGLFQTAIVQSGGETVHRPEAALAAARIVAESIVAQGGQPSQIHAMPGQQLMRLQAELRRRFDRPFPFRAVVDGEFLPEPPVAAITAGAARGLRLLIGTNRDESILFTNPAAAERPLAQSELANLDLAAALPVQRRYEAAFADLLPLERRVRFLTAEEYWHASMRIAIAHQASGAAETYVYRFDMPSTMGPVAGWAAHGAELPYMWNMPDDRMMTRIYGPMDAPRRALAADMNLRWARFARGEAPNLPGAVPWPRFTQARELLRFGERVEAAPLDAAELALWDEAATVK